MRELNCAYSLFQCMNHQYFKFDAKRTSDINSSDCAPRCNFPPKNLHSYLNNSKTILVDT